MVDPDTPFWLDFRRHLPPRAKIALAGHFTTAAEALARLPCLEAEVALVEVRLPDMAGHECARRLSALKAGLFRGVALVSASLDIRDLFLGWHLGVRAIRHDLLRKPDRLEDDIRAVFALPIMREAWERAKPLLDNEFVKFVETCMEAEEGGGGLTWACRLLRSSSCGGNSSRWLTPRDSSTARRCRRDTW